VDEIIAQAKRDAEAEIARKPKTQRPALKYRLEVDLRKYEAILREQRRYGK
jgi:hypothetical protein